jgi:hypothetical protein
MRTDKGRARNPGACSMIRASLFVVVSLAVLDLIVHRRNAYLVIIISTYREFRTRNRRLKRYGR